jgi:hypothetical protein
MTVNGIDVSTFQTTTPSLTGLSFLFARATYGTSVDGRYQMHAANARKAGLVQGAYGFGVYGDGAGQAKAFLAAAGAADLFVLDLETESGRPRMTDAQAKAFIAAVKAAGHKCGLYHSESGFPSLGQDYNWVANWSQVPSIGWTFHQYRGSPLDLDHYNGTLAQLQALAGKTAPKPPAPAPAHTLHIAKGAKVTAYKVTGRPGGCLVLPAAYFKTWTGNASHVPCGAEAHLPSCNGQPGAFVVAVTVAGSPFTGLYVNVGTPTARPPGISVTTP